MIHKRFLYFALAVYIFSGLTFLSEIIGEITGYRLFTYSWTVHEIIEIITLIGFAIGGVIIWRAMGALRQRNMVVETQLLAVSGEFYRMIEAQFALWQLTEAEKDVALMTIKGLPVSDIAKLRETSEGTVKAQSTAIYKKAGVKGRTQLLSSLIEDVLTTLPIKRLQE